MGEKVSYKKDGANIIRTVVEANDLRLPGQDEVCGTYEQTTVQHWTPEGFEVFKKFAKDTSEKAHAQIVNVEKELEKVKDLDVGTLDVKMEDIFKILMKNAKKCNTKALKNELQTLAQMGQNWSRKRSLTGQLAKLKEQTAGMEVDMAELEKI